MLRPLCLRLTMAHSLYSDMSGPNVSRWLCTGTVVLPGISIVLCCPPFIVPWQHYRMRVTWLIVVILYLYYCRKGICGGLALWLAHRHALAEGQHGPDGWRGGCPTGTLDQSEACSTAGTFKGQRATSAPITQSWASGLIDFSNSATCSRLHSTVGAYHTVRPAASTGK
jgi:hypothetical protein